MFEYYQKVNELLDSKQAFVSVILVDTTGSVPQDAGNKMLVTENGLLWGTVGGGKLEKRAIEEALLLLRSDQKQRTHFVNWSLSKDIGMTCGGLVKLFFELHNKQEWEIVVFGAGHVANAVINLLIKLETRITCLDPRQDWLDKLPDSPSLKPILCQDMVSHVPEVPEQAFTLLITMGHATDSPILVELLKQKHHLPYLGVIGSKAKAIKLREDIEAAGLAISLFDRVHCPMGLPLGTNHPQEIAISIVAELIQERDRHRASSDTPRVSR